MKKAFLCFIFSFIFSILCAVGTVYIHRALYQSHNGVLRSIYEMLPSIDYVSFLMFFVIPFGVPLGCIIGVLLVDRVILQLSACTAKRVLLNFMVVFLGMLIMVSIYVLDDYGYIPYISDYIRQDAFVYSMPVIAALLSSWRYSVVLRKKSSEHNKIESNKK
jgi:hypothetical protein